MTNEAPTDQIRGRLVNFVILAIVFIVGTVVTQVGGVLFVVSWLFFRKRVFVSDSRKHRFLSWAAVCGVYLIATFLLIPPVAKFFGRSALPIFATENAPIKPRSIWYCLLNRHYVTAELEKVVAESAQSVNQKFPGTRIEYLDANFPFFDGFPLFPHLSHQDGRKIDFTFLYRDESDSKKYRSSPSPIGYWIYEPPKTGEPNPYAEKSCFLRWDFELVQGLGRKSVIDTPRTREFLRTLLGNPKAEKVLLELHLHRRFGFPSHPKLRFQQCNAARHDDHIHFQIRK